ncbi:MAG: hypothetical protein IPL53_12345 [Ignavibacteria bacterium]|nr:hypothetical protein [Ignavibacteria bacterium]
MTNTVIDLLYLAKQNGIDILLVGEQLQLKLPKNKDIDKDLLRQLKDNKALIIEFLRDNKRSKNGKSKISIFDRENTQLIPLSFSQERLWFVDRLEGSLQYHIPAIYRLKGKLNKGALEQSFRKVVNRHEVLRTIFLEEDGVPYQIVKQSDDWELPVIDGSKFKDDSDYISQYTQQLIKAPFDLTKDFMLRTVLIKLEEEEHILIVILHHIASDGWSISILVKEVTAIYDSLIKSQPSELEPLKIQYADFALWQRKYLQGRNS